MKKFFLGLALVAGLATTAVAQSRAVSYRAEVGASLANLSVSGDVLSLQAQSKLSLRANVGLEYMLNPSGLYTYAALGYRNAGAKAGKDGSAALHDATLGAGLGYRFRLSDDFKLSLEGGLLGAYSIVGKHYLGNMSSDIFADKDHGLNRASLDANLSVALEYQRYYFRVGTEQGITKLNKEGDGSVRNMNAYFAVGLRF